jgi:uncharacterized protein (DUF983 family)
MGTAPKLATVGDILRQRCPRCRTGNIFRYSIFRGFAKMYERCPVCDLKFDREPGYFLGAMYVSYGLGIVMVAVIAARASTGTKVRCREWHCRGLFWIRSRTVRHAPKYGISDGVRGGRGNVR